MRLSLPERVGFVPRLAALYAGVFLFSGMQLPFFPVWLKAKEVDPALIGVIVAMPMLARVVAIPLAAREADRRDAVRMAILLAGWASVFTFILVGLSAGSAAILVSYAVAALVYAPVLPLTETYALKAWPSAAARMGRCACGARPRLSPGISSAASRRTRCPRTNSSG
jgi:PPP family 3-phenylpropionic acid transporter